MNSFDLKSINTALSDSNKSNNGVDFTGKSLKLDTEDDAKPIVDAINQCPELHHLTLTGNTLGVSAAHAIAKALEHHPELKQARWSDMFTGRMKTEIPPALKALGDGMIAAGTQLSVLDLSDNAFGPIGVEGLAKLLQSDVCAQLQELRLNNNGLGITGGKLLASALLERAPRLKTFIAGRNRLENEGAKALAKVFQKMTSLEQIAMPQNGIYHVGISALAESFQHNPGLRSLNLNDNTIGPKGAQHIAQALPKLKNLKEINFGDCLLKCKGALALAQGFKDNQLQLESIDLSHNEIGHVACMQFVDCITSQPDCSERLNKVVLSGNSLGGSDHKQTMKDKLGDCAELSDGEGSDDEYVTGSEEESSDGEENESQSEDSATEDAQHNITTIQGLSVSLNNSGVEEVESIVEKFLQQPTLENFKYLGDNAVEVIDAHLQIIKEPSDLIQAYVEATFKISGLSNRDAKAEAAAKQMYSVLLARAGAHHAQQWVLANNMLIGLGLIKSENKQNKILWDLDGCYSVLSTVISSSQFPASLRETLRFFLKSKKEALDAKGLHLHRYPQLVQ